MVAKDENGKNVPVPKLLLTKPEEIRRFCNCLKQIALKKERNLHESDFDYNSAEALSLLKNYNVGIVIS